MNMLPPHRLGCKAGRVPLLALLLACLLVNWALVGALHHHEDGAMHDECAVCQILCGSSSAERTDPDPTPPAVYTDNPPGSFSCAIHECVTYLSARPHAPPQPA